MLTGRIAAALGTIGKMSPDERIATAELLDIHGLLDPGFVMTNKLRTLIADEYAQQRSTPAPEITLAPALKPKKRLSPTKTEELFYKCWYECVRPLGVDGIPFATTNGKAFFTKNSREAYAAIESAMGSLDLFETELSLVFSKLAEWSYQRASLIRTVKDDHTPLRLADIFAIPIYDKGFINEILAGYIIVEPSVPKDGGAKLKALANVEPKDEEPVPASRPVRTQRPRIVSSTRFPRCKTKPAQERTRKRA